MGDPIRGLGRVQLLAAQRLSLREVPPPEPSPGEREAMDQVWAKATLSNPALFDGPVAVCAGVSWDSEEHCVLSWARSTYRNFALRMVPWATSWLPSLFVAVLQPSDDGEVLVGRMAGTTAAPGRWQLPGGTVDPPASGGALDAQGLGRHAALELAEELGVDGCPEDLSFWSVVRCENGNVGVLFCAPARPARELQERFQSLRRADAAHGGTSELEEIVLVGREDHLDALIPAADFLRPTIHHFFGRQRSSNGSAGLPSARRT